MARNNASVASRPKSMMPFSIGSGGSGISASLSSASSTRSDSSGIWSGGANVRSTASSISFSIGSSVTTQVWPIRALHPAGNVEAAAAGGRDIERGGRGQDFAQACDFGHCRAVVASASMSRCSPVSGICATAIGTRQGSALVGHAARPAHGSTPAAIGRRTGNFQDGPSNAASSSAAKTAMAASA